MAKLSRKWAVLCASTMMFGAALGVPTFAQAEESGNYVSFGDSIPSNPTILDVVMTKVHNKNPQVQWPTVQEGRCAQGEDNVGKRVAAKTGLSLSDYSCPGATAYTAPGPQDAIPHNQFSQQVDQALAEGALNANTKLVSVIIGVNDTYQPANQNRSQEERNNLYHAEVTNQLRRIKQAAPNAKVVMVGYPDETDGGNYTCATNLLGMTSHWYFPFVAYYQDEIRAQQREAAAAEGVPFLDMVDEINVSKANSGCLNIDPSQRYNAAIFDDGGLHNLAGHLTGPGNEYYAERISSYY
ncbi:hypothetical protein GP475_11020 [Corynebacterium poyangense]|uniref:SGNH hydrolase-type esterase domain-containing protein n=1 Tax=Corynebacterium poyangense TaxID=2684405 RepID=A0A7H0SRC6_9CORY|nr:GDSL-type esterase/lipase family protein [Corynebacterium poyangense]MBZ8176535.1 hypothetical protein [Corynebacterium poyangense]QNQ91101.1 hypothetical protein GP475_11020 [Corynebacterium poyangense]